MRKLHELSADEILAQLELRSDALMEADKDVGEKDATLKAYEATQALAHRDAGASMAEAEKRVRAAPEWAKRYRELQNAHAEAAELKRSYQRAMTAAELWRTEQSTARAFHK